MIRPSKLLSALWISTHLHFRHHLRLLALINFLIESLRFLFRDSHTQSDILLHYLHLCEFGFPVEFPCPLAFLTFRLGVPPVHTILLHANGFSKSLLNRNGISAALTLHPLHPFGFLFQPVVIGPFLCYTEPFVIQFLTTFRFSANDFQVRPT